MSAQLEHMNALKSATTLLDHTHALVIVDTSLT